jgi:hypothetical protein
MRARKGGAGGRARPRDEGAGLAETVVPVWESSNGRIASLAPPNYHPSFRSIKMNYARSTINRTLTYY